MRGLLSDYIFERIKRLKADEDHKIAVLTRNNRVNIALSEVFDNRNSKLSRKEQIPFFLVDEFKFFRRQEIKDILAYLKFISNKYDNNSLKRILLRFAGGIGRRTIDFFDEETSSNLGLRLIDMVDENTHSYKDPYQPLVSNLHKGNVVVFDVKATGLDTLKDEIIQIAVVKIDIAGNEVGKFERFLKPKMPVGDSEIVHGFSDDFLKKNGEDSHAVLKDFLDFIKDSLLVAHNIGYDLNILKSQVSRLGLTEPQIADYFDTLDIVRRFHSKLENHRLEMLCKAFKTSSRADHNAMNDIMATKEILLKMVKEDIEPKMTARSIAYNKHLKKFAMLWCIVI
ncbi:exonuclease, DNA polymerase III, epsilon subunit family [Peptoclostridium litorale DSM 5388]|uniref:DNA polymerase III PolC-type n=1 Tax=Peptoclostridium litorale DSM 5388 TaxID=1121324 RepID=A0A069RP74_PEPLI|nr:3'-5' exonuclease [Peptoclostridium litorale]KDR95977.1 DNA polymerase III PolC-type [Peptoclostridium litorale DSM 5388]SIO08818.1 exonuclease, DNA polymerase III, epsilon subunit family [Peptoclostridium litorale DSM 5388]